MNKQMRFKWIFSFYFNSKWNEQKEIGCHTFTETMWYNNLKDRIKKIPSHWKSFYWRKLNLENVFVTKREFVNYILCCCWFRFSFCAAGAASLVAEDYNNLTVYLKHICIFILSLNVNDRILNKKNTSDNINQYLINKQKGICGDALNYYLPFLSYFPLLQTYFPFFSLYYLDLKKKKKVIWKFPIYEQNIRQRILYSIRI